MSFPKRNIKKSDPSDTDFKIKRLIEGDTFYNYNGELNHIVHLFADKNIDIVVYKHWNPSRGWLYEADTLELVLYRICLLYKNLADKSKSNNLRKKFFELNNISYEGY